MKMKNKIYNALLITTIILLLYILFTNNKSRDRVPVLIPEIKELVDMEVTKFKRENDANGFEHMVFSDKNNVINSINEVSDSTREELRVVKELLKIKDKQLEHYIKYSATLEGKLLKATKTDSSYKYTDKWADIEFFPPKDDQSDGHFNFSYDVDLNYTEYWKRKGIFGKKKHYIDFWISDPRAKILGVDRVKIEPKKDRFTVDLKASAFYTDRLNTGLDMGFSFNRTRLGAGYFYDFNDNDWRPIVSANFKILEF